MPRRNADGVPMLSAWPFPRSAPGTDRHISYALHALDKRLRGRYDMTHHATCAVLVAFVCVGTVAFAQVPSAEPADPVTKLVGQLNLEQYKATIKGLTQFGDRRQGTERNRKALDWIEAQLKSYGCPTERLTYTYTPRV